MPVAVCPNGHRMQIQDAHLGRTITCPMCHTPFVATPQPGGPPAPPAPGASGEAAFADLGAGGMGVPGGGVSIRKQASFDVMTTANWFIGKPLLFLGLVLVLFGRGCDSISLRSVGRTQALYQYAVNEAVKKKEDLKDNKVIQQMSEDATNAMLGHRMWSYWYVWVFVFGTLLLMTGLLILAFTGQGSERWVAYIIIAIVSFSIYVGGAAWIESIASSFMQGPSGPTHIGPPFK